MTLQRQWRYIMAVAFAAALPMSMAVAGPVPKDGHKVIVYFDTNLSAKGRAFFERDFRDNGFYSAIATSIALDETYIGYSRGNSDRAFARKNALAWCNNLVKQQGGKGPCKLWAELVPSRKRPAVTVGGATLSQGASEAYVTYQAFDGRPFKAFAFDKTGAWAWETSKVSLAEARSRALASCQGLAVEAGETRNPDNTCRLAK
ncbi:MAG: hypothetical protein AAFZ04_02460 [Pseudomonadota bacterium]